VGRLPLWPNFPDICAKNSGSSICFWSLSGGVALPAFRDILQIKYLFCFQVYFPGSGLENEKGDGIKRVLAGDELL
jgi:hypothetical protein